MNEFQKYVLILLVTILNKCTMINGVAEYENDEKLIKKVSKFIK